MKDDDHFFVLFSFYRLWPRDAFDDAWETLGYELQHNHPITESLQRFSPLRLDSLRSKEVASLTELPSAVS